MGSATSPHRCTSTESCAEKGFIAVREELGLEVLDPGASAAFAVADHQVAHIYVNDRSKMSQVREAIEGTPGVERVLGGDGKAALHIDHPRAGDLVAIADARSWFTYYYWFDDERAPDYARTVDIHRKPGYDPVELLLDPAIRNPTLTVGWKLAKRSLGFRMLLDVIPLDATLVKGSHGRPGLAGPDEGPCLPHEADAPRAGRTYRLDGGLRLVTSASGSD